MHVRTHTLAHTHTHTQRMGAELWTLEQGDDDSDDLPELLPIRFMIPASQVLNSVIPIPPKLGRVVGDSCPDLSFKALSVVTQKHPWSLMQRFNFNATTTATITTQFDDVEHLLDLESELVGTFETTTSDSCAYRSR